MNNTLHQRLAALRRKHSEEKLARERLAQNKPGSSKDGKASSSKKSSLAAENVGYIDPREVVKRPGEHDDGGVDGGGKLVNKEDDEKMIDGYEDGDRGVVNEEAGVEMREKEEPDRQKEKTEEGLEWGKETVMTDVTVQCSFRAITESDDADSDDEAGYNETGDDGDEDSTPPLREFADGADSFLYQGGNILSDTETTAFSEMAAISHDDHEQQRQREREEEDSMEKRFLALASGIRKGQQSDGGVLGVSGQLSGADELKERFKRVFEGRYIAGSSRGAVRGGSEFSHDVGLEVEDEEPDISV
ncbi:hypothetical protein L211DRAFT_608694 [Terfezia boudieri ATCC MYA-4762]|uniref:Uncharacterized protein n=1 Tax=Terfezia boudieri ATCC MYA-4762 TaxID=1051890 RepID=A0A3N4LW35_9PEZI|nr:hypothetical protein L211DRAFT_608694 [Terfezia boudieri ATCC MYA-4762]